MLESVRALHSCTTDFSAPAISDITIDVKETAGSNVAPTWTVTATGCTVGATSFTMQVLEYDSWTSLGSGTFD